MLREDAGRFPRQQLLRNIRRKATSPGGAAEHAQAARQVHPSLRLPFQAPALHRESTSTSPALTYQALGV